MSRVGRVNDNLNLSRAIGDMVYKRNHLRLAKDQIISAEPDVCRWVLLCRHARRLSFLHQKGHPT